MECSIAVTDPADVPHIFERALVRARRTRAAALSSRADLFLVERMAGDICDRLAAVERQFHRAVIHGGRASLFRDALAREPAASSRIENLIQSDVAAVLAGPGGVVADADALPFRAESLSLFISLATLHAIDDLPGALVQIRAALRPDGLFIGSFFGGETLSELRAALGAAEVEIEGGLSPRIAPFVDVREGAGLLQRAGFSLPVADRDRVTVTYETPFALFQDLRAMGETNALSARRRRPMRRATLGRAMEIYAERYALPNGRVRATFDIVTLTGWTPHDNQQVPLKPGSAKASLADALKGDG